MCVCAYLVYVCILIKQGHDIQGVTTLYYGVTPSRTRNVYVRRRASYTDT